jgi:hypothetical protein
VRPIGPSSDILSIARDNAPRESIEIGGLMSYATNIGMRFVKGSAAVAWPPRDAGDRVPSPCFRRM